MENYKQEYIRVLRQMDTPQPFRDAEKEMRKHDTAAQLRAMA